MTNTQLLYLIGSIFFAAALAARDEESSAPALVSGVIFGVAIYLTLSG